MAAAAATVLKQRAFAAVIWSGVETLGATGIGTLFVLIFARFVGPEEFGLFAAATMISGFVAKIANFGFSTVIVQLHTLQQNVIDTAITLAFGLAMFLSAIIVLFRVPFAELVGVPQAANIVAVIAIAPVFQVGNAVLTALLRRELKMRVLAHRTLAANAVAGIIAVPVVLSGHGLIGLAVQFIGAAFLSLLLVWRLGGIEFRLRFDPMVAAILLRSGAPVAGNQLIAHYNRQSPKIFVALFLGPSELGILSMAMRFYNLLFSLFGTTLSNVIMPLMSVVNRTTGESARSFIRVLRVGSVAIAPPFLLVSLLAVPILQVVVGETWIAAGPALAIFSLAALLSSLQAIIASTKLGLGLSGAVTSFSVLRAIVGTALLAAAVPFGLIGVALAFLARQLIVDPLQGAFLARRIGARIRETLGALSSVALASVALVAVGYGTKLLFVGSPPITEMAVVSAVGLASYLAAVALWDRATLAEILVLVRRQAR